MTTKRRTHFGYRMFNGEQYRYSIDAGTKSEARILAEHRRKQGKRARVTKEKTLHGSVYYAVWVRGK